MMYGYPGFGMGGWGWLMMLLWLVILVAVIYFAFRLLQRITGKNQSSNSDAEEILRKRYARGEIDTETFENMRQHLKK